MPETARTREIPSTTQQASQPVLVPDRRAELQREINYLNHPGRHSTLSPVPGSRANELSNLRNQASTRPEIVDFARAVLEGNFYNTIPKAQLPNAEKAAKRIFEEYLAKYAGAGVTTGNIVEWTKNSPFGGHTWVSDQEDMNNTWNVHVIAPTDNLCEKGMCSPSHVRALHEVMHVEEVPLRAAANWDKDKIEVVSELLPSLMTIIAQDQIHKELNNIPLDRKISYGRMLRWNNHSVDIGRVANFYRSLIQQYGNIGAAVSSPESLAFMQSGTIGSSIVPRRIH